MLNACDNDELNLFIGRKMLAEFYYHTMPLLEPYVSFQELQPELIEKYLPSMAKFQFYLDTDKDKIFCQAKVVYDEVAYPLSFQDSSRQKQAHLRDIHAEEDALYHIQKYFETEDVKNEMFFSEADDAVYTLLQDGISDLMRIGEVFCTDRLKNLNLHKKLKASIGVSIKSGIMEIDISSTELSPKELLDILSSYRKKKRYHRLSNGDFIRADNEDIELLSSMLDTLKISSKEFLQGNMKIPAYRALYLDKLLEQNESFYIDRDKNFKNLIREFKTLTDSDYEVPASLKSIMRSYQVTGFQWLKLLEDALLKENISYYKITGSTKKEERVRLVKEFNDGTVPVFLISLKAGGTGLNLTGADTVIHYDPWWNLAVQNQATDRAHRIGQKKIVTVYRLIVKNSIEEKIIKPQESKKVLADEILSGENGNLSSLSKEDLLALLQ